MLKDQQKNLALPSDSASKIMAHNVPIVLDTATVAEIEQLLLREAKNLETINYIYIVDSKNRLVGVISIKEVFGLPKTTSVAQVMKRELVKVRPHTDQERVAMLAIKHSLKAIPVVDAEGKFLGAVPSDVILYVLHQEHIEDILHSIGIHAIGDPSKDLTTSSAIFHFKKRLPWLMVGTLGGFGAAILVGSFESLLEELLLLAAFIPALVYMADAVGVQTQMIFIRSLILDQSLDFKKYLQREIIVGVLLAVVLAAMIGVLSFIWHGLPILSLILSLSFFLAIIFAVVVAVLLPWAFYKFHQDPAIASGPLATITRDILSIIIYFLTASIVLTISSS